MAEIKGRAGMRLVVSSSQSRLRYYFKLYFYYIFVPSSLTNLLSRRDSSPHHVACNEAQRVPFLFNSMLDGTYGSLSYSTKSGSAASSTVASLESATTQEVDVVEQTNASLSARLLQVLGFAQNPLAENDGQRNTAASDLRLSMLSNFSTAYNVVNISLALRLIDANGSLCSSALIAGMILGQLVGGTLGDVLGRHRALALVLGLQILGALGSACAVPLGKWTVVQVLAVWRCVLGIGCGGVYPLSATLTAESESLSPVDKSKAIALAFSFQGVGYLVVPIVAWILVTVMDKEMAWRLLLGMGALPGALLTILRLRCTSMQSQSERQPTPVKPTTRIVPVSLWHAISEEPHLIRNFIGTGGCWMLFDIVFYGNTLFQPIVLTRAFGASETVERTIRHTLVIALMSLPGYFVSVYAVGRQSPRFIQMQGFFIMGCLYLWIGLRFHELAENRLLLMLVYGSTFFFSNYGPNSSTFMLPSLTFSRTCRSTLNGLCAASGKVGALIGATIFVMAANRFGAQCVFICCSLLALLGCTMTAICVPAEVGVPRTFTVSSTTGLSSRSLTPPCDETNILLNDNNEILVNKVRMKVVHSEPSLFDLNA